MRSKKFACLLLVLLAGCQSVNKPQGLNVKVKRVISGQTIEVVSNDKTMLVRLIGIDAPDLPQQPFGKAAKALLMGL